ncbi:hypothetical protein [Tenacibaculum phage Larrie]|nr:hypothetical protein [Tenacibaculum phage Larrie]
MENISANDISKAAGKWGGRSSKTRILVSPETKRNLEKALMKFLTKHEYKY